MFSNDKIREELSYKLSMENISNKTNGLEKFLQIYIDVLDKLALQKKKYNRGNTMAFMNKPLTRAHMKRHRLRNRFLKNRSEVNGINFIKQRNYRVSLLRKTKKQYYANLSEKDVADNKKFWKTVKPFLSDKLKSNEKITLVEDDKIFTQDIKVAEELNSFFSNVVKNLKIPEYNETNPLPEEIANPTLKSIIKCDKYSSVTAIRNLNIRSHFEFSFDSVAEVLKEIKKLNLCKAAQSTDIPVKILKDNAEIFADYICGFFNESLNCCKFPSILKRANVTPVFKKGYLGSKQNYFQRFLKSYFVNNLQCLQIKIFQNISAALEEFLVHNIP